jgi:hypothetical protein
VRTSNVLLEQRLTFTFSALTESEMLSICSHYNGQQGRFLSFNIPSDLLCGTVTPANFTPVGYAWIYAGRPSITDIGLQRYDVSVELMTLPAEGANLNGAELTVGASLVTVAAMTREITTSFIGGLAGSQFAGLDITVTATFIAGSVSTQPAGLNLTVTATLVAGAASSGGQIQSAQLLYTGNGSTLSVTGAGFRPGLVLTKQRNGTNTHAWFDKVRGATVYLRGSTAASEVTNATTLTAFDSDGFTLGSNAAVNVNSATYVAFCLKEGGAVTTNTNGTVTTSVSVNTDFEWSTFTYTGVGNATNTVGHGLSGVPDLVIIKARTSTFSHWVGSPLLGTPKAYDFRTTSVTPVPSVFQAFGATTVTVDSNVMSAGATYVGWAFKMKPGVHDVALFTGNGSTTYTQTIGWQPRFILMKNTTTLTANWHIFYRASGGTGYAERIFPHTIDAEAVSTTVQITSTGFSVDVGGPGNVSGGTTQALYWAVA